MLGWILTFVKFYDGDGNVLVPKSVRPIMDYGETYLGDKKGANRQFRIANLHIREYDDYYTIHKDRIDPKIDPFGHLLVDAPEYLVSILYGIHVGKQFGIDIYDKGKAAGKSKVEALSKALLASCLAGSASGSTFYILNNLIRKINKSI
jgi:hypothetical protein